MRNDFDLCMDNLEGQGGMLSQGGFGEAFSNPYSGLGSCYQQFLPFLSEAEQRLLENYVNGL